MSNTDKKLWKENINKFNLEWPDENVVRFLKKSYSIDKDNIKIMDFGCGSGRNSIFMAAEGFQVYAVDYNKESIDLTVNKVRKYDGNIVGIQNNNTDVPLEDALLDCAICWGSLFLNNAEKRKLLLKEVNRALKMDGLFLANWRSKEDYFYQKGSEIENNLFILDDRAEEHGLSGMTYYFADITDLEELYKECGFQIYNIEKKEFTINNMKVKNSHWHIWAKKI